jgi:ankyrin repeat protein
MGNALGSRWGASALLAAASPTAIAAELQRSPHFVHAPLTWNDRTMWHLAAEQGHLALLQALQQAVLECFDERQQRQQRQQGQQRQQRGPAGGKLHRQLSRRGDTPGDVLRSLANAADVKGTTPLMVAAGSGHSDCVRHLLSLGADPWQQVGSGANLARLAIMRTPADQPWRRRAGLHPGTVVPQDLLGRTAVHHAAVFNHSACILELSAGEQQQGPGAAGAARDTDGVRWAGQARGCWLRRCGRLLLESAPVLTARLVPNGPQHTLLAATPHGRRLMDQQSCSGFAPLHYAVWSGSLQAVQALLACDARQDLRNSSRCAGARACSLVVPALEEWRGKCS